MARSHKGKKISVALKRSWGKPSVRRRRLAIARSAAYREKQRRISLRNWRNRHVRAHRVKGIRRAMATEQYSKNLAAAMRPILASASYRRKMRRIVKARWKNPKYRRKNRRAHLAVVRSDAFRLMKRRHMRVIWADPRKSHALAVAVSSHPNGLERKVASLLRRMKLRFRFGKYLLGYVPDFILSEYKVIIECDGDRWHALPIVMARDRKKNKIFRSAGYTILRFKGSIIRHHEDRVRTCVLKTLRKIKELDR